jgi:glucose/arabinose dehydrogenase
MSVNTRVFLALALVLLLATGAVAAFVWFGPIAVSDKKVLLDFLLGRGINTPTEEVIAGNLRAPDGFTVNLYAGDLPLARWMRFTAGGDLIVSRTRAGEVVLLERDRDGDGKADGRHVLIGELEGPHGLEIRDGWLWIAETTGVGRIRFDENSGTVAGPFERVITGLTGNGFHLTRTIRFGPDGYLYLTQGSSCNVCVEEDPRRGTMMRFNADGSGGEIYATGLRNSVGFDWAPWDNGLYATENGRDLLGDDFPPDELNRIEKDQFYGWPFVNGFNVPDPEFGRDDDGKVAMARAPVHGFRAHNAPLGIHFLRNARVPPDFQRSALVALHGSWNRAQLDGYKVVSLHWLEDGSISERDFVTGFLGPDGIIGRPSDVTEGPDGALYVADDYGGAIYRISYVKPQAAL